MKSNQKGFSVVEILIVIVVVGLLGAVGWLVYDRQKNKTDNKSTDTQTSQTENQKHDAKENSTTQKIDTTIHEVFIELKTEADLAKLPDYTPISFKNYLSENLQNNKPFDNGESTVTETWKISKISQVNIQGGQVPTDSNGVGYPGGAPAIWVLTPAGTWDQETLNGPVCTSKNGGKIYEEFVPTCYDDAHPNGMKNPNGSIKSLAQ